MALAKIGGLEKPHNSNSASSPLLPSPQVLASSNSFRILHETRKKQKHPFQFRTPVSFTKIETTLWLAPFSNIKPRKKNKSCRNRREQRRHRVRETEIKIPPPYFGCFSHGKENPYK
jgi:hypothetical protein